MSNLKLWDQSVDTSSTDEIDREMSQNPGSEFMKLEVGKNTVRFLPNLTGEGKKGEPPVKVVYEHFIDGIGAEGGTFRFVCPRKQLRGKGPQCPVCLAGDQLRASGNALDNKRAKKMTPSQRVYAAVINRKAPEIGPRILSFGKTIWEQLGEIKNDDEGGVWWNPGPDGFDVNIHRKGQGKQDTEYTVRIGKRGPLSDDDDLLESWAESKPNLGAQATIMDEDELMESLGPDFRGAIGAGKKRRQLRDATPDADDEKPAPRRTLGSGSNGSSNGHAGKIKRPKKSVQQSIDDDNVIDIEPEADEGDVPY